MSKICVQVEADTPHELVNVLRELLGTMTAVLEGSEEASASTLTSSADSPAATSQAASSDASNAAGSENVPIGSAPAGVEAAGKRKPTRGKKAAEAAPAPTKLPETPQAADVSAMFADVPSAASTAAAEKVVITRDLLREAGNKHMELVGVGDTVKVLAEFGVKKLSELDEAKWPDIHAVFVKNIKAKEATSVLE